MYTNNNPLSHLSSVRRAATEQRWAAQLASFDFKIKDQSGKSNANALSRQHPSGLQDIAAMLPGTVMLKPLQQALGLKRVEATQAATVAMPQHTSAELCLLQQTSSSDPGTVGLLGKETAS